MIYAQDDDDHNIVSEVNLYKTVRECINTCYET